MKFIKSKNANINYLAKIIDIKTFTPHPDPETTKLKLAHVDGSIGLQKRKNKQPGFYISLVGTKDICKFVKKDLRRF